MMNRLLDELDARIGIRKLMHEGLDEPIPGGASFAYVFGSAALVLFTVQIATGLILAFHYSASATDAWASVAYIERVITMGSIVRGIHHHAAGGMVVVVGVHMLQVALFGAYKKPREGNWLTGLGLLGLVLGFALTGYLLPWDQTGYWATKVATSIAGTVPVVGPAIQAIAQGGNDYGNLTLTRFYSIHVTVLPILTIGLVALHVFLFRMHGVTPKPWATEAEIKSKVDAFWPKQMAYDAIVAGLIVCFIGWLAVTKGAPLEAPADPSSNFIARPEWYFLFLFQLLKYFEGPLQIVGTVVIPGLASGFLAALPFLDRSSSRAFSARLPWLGLLGAGVLAQVTLTSLAVRHDAGDPKIAEQKLAAKKEAEVARRLAANGVPAAGAAYMMAHDPMVRGERVFERECLGCHVLDGRGPDNPKAPDLTGYGSKAWLRQVLRDADSKRLFGLTKVEGMKSFAQLDAKTFDDLVALVYAQRDPTAPPLASRAGADKLDELKCTNCHELEKAESLEGPSLFQYGSREWVKQVIEDPGRDYLYGTDNSMPAFGARLSAEDFEAVLTFVMSLRDRAPSQTWPFVDDAGPVPSPRTVHGSK